MTVFLKYFASLHSGFAVIADAVDLRQLEYSQDTKVYGWLMHVGIAYAYVLDGPTMWRYHIKFEARRRFVRGLI